MGLSSDHSVSPDTVVRQRGLTLKGLPFPTTRRRSAEQTQTTRVTDATTTTLSSVVVSSLPPTALNQQFPLQVRSQSVSQSVGPIFGGELVRRMIARVGTHHASHSASL